MFVLASKSKNPEGARYWFGDEVPGVEGIDWLVGRGRIAQRSFPCSQILVVPEGDTETAVLTLPNSREIHSDTEAHSPRA
jgi:hypothetical protein